MPNDTDSSESNQAFGPAPIHPTDDEVLTNVVYSQFASEADQLVTALLAAERAAAAWPANGGLFAALDANAAAYADVCAAFMADIKGLPPDAQAVAEVRQFVAEVRQCRQHGAAMAHHALCNAAAHGLPAVQPLLDAFRGLLCLFVDAEDDDSRDFLEEYVACGLGDSGPRYCLGA